MNQLRTLKLGKEGKKKDNSSAPGVIRTQDLLITRPMLYHVSTTIADLKHKVLSLEFFKK